MNVLLSNEQYVTFSNIDNLLNFKNIKNEKIFNLNFSHINIYMYLDENVKFYKYICRHNSVSIFKLEK